MHLYLICAVLLLLLSHRPVWSKFGVDLTYPLQPDAWAALNAEFAIVRLMKHTGDVDNVGIRNLRNAMDANITELSGYIYPCLSSSYFATVERITCLSAEAQIQALIDQLNLNVAEMESHDRTSWPPTGQPTGMPSGQPTGVPSSQPSMQPSGMPSGQPSSKPSYSPDVPTPEPTFVPTFTPTTAQPTGQPSGQPSSQPSSKPSRQPTGVPSGQPSSVPTNPTSLPTSTPSMNMSAPTMNPTTFFPTSAPTATPTEVRPTSQPTNAPGQETLQIRRLFLMVEDESPPRYYDADQTVNIQYFNDLYGYAYQYGIQLGVFTTLRYWTEIMTTDTGYSVNVSRDSLPLWTPRYDSTASMDFFVPFGGWDKPYMKQYKGGSAAARREDVTWRINENYIKNGSYDFDGLNATIIAPY